MDMTPEIKDAIRKAIDLHGNVTQFAKHLGIAHSTVLFWLSGKTTEVSGRLWAQKLRPALLPFLGAGVFADKPLPKNFFAIPADKVSDLYENCRCVLLPIGYEPWKEGDILPQWTPVRFKHNGKVVGTLGSYDDGAREELKLGIYEIQVGAEKGYEQACRFACSYELAFEMLEVQVGGEWVPAGRKLGANSESKEA